MKTVTASEANRKFSKILQDVSHGEVITVISRGKPVATIAPAKVEDNQRKAAKQRLIERLRHRKVSGSRTWSRNELYD